MTPSERRAEVEAALRAWAPHYGYVLVPIEVMVAQSDLETGAWTSNLCANYNNAFGMHFPTVRETKATGYVIGDGGAKVATYDSLTDSAQDYLMRQRYFNVPDTDDPAAYIEATVASGYASGSNYANAWADRVIGVPYSETGGPGLGGLLALLAVGWAITRS